MDPFDYSKGKLSEREFMWALPAIIIGVSILSLPSDIAKATSFSDGWISILIAGIITTLITVLAVKVGLLFPDQSFLDFAAKLVTRPIAITILLMYVISGILICAYVTRSAAYISQQYLFDRTPMEALGLSFLLVVIYAVSGTRAGVFRLNILFMPIIFCVFLFVGLFNIKLFEADNYLPLFKTDFKGYWQGITKSAGAFIGFGIGLFYVSHIEQPRNLIKRTFIGMSIPVLFYLFVFFVSIGVFGNTETANLVHPTLELALRVEIPEAIFERIDAFVFTIWTMAIFTTASMSMDVVVLLLSSLFKNSSKQLITITLGPIIFYFAMLPKTYNQVAASMKVLSVFSATLPVLVIIGFYLIAKLKGVSDSD